MFKNSVRRPGSLSQIISRARARYLKQQNGLPSLFEKEARERAPVFRWKRDAHPPLWTSSSLARAHAMPFLFPKEKDACRFKKLGQVPVRRGRLLHQFLERFGRERGAFRLHRRRRPHRLLRRRVHRSQVCTVRVAVIGVVAVCVVYWHRHSGGALVERVRGAQRHAGRGLGSFPTSSETVCGEKRTSKMCTWMIPKRDTHANLEMESQLWPRRVAEL